MVECSFTNKVVVDLSPAAATKTSYMSNGRDMVIHLVVRLIKKT